MADSLLPVEKLVEKGVENLYKDLVKPLRTCDLGVQAISTSSICQGGGV